MDSPLCLCMWAYWEPGGAGWGSPGALTCMLGPRRLLCCWCCRWVNASLGLFTPAILAWCLRSWMSSRVSSSGCSQARISEERENILENHLGSYINWESQTVARPVYFRKIQINKKKKNLQYESNSCILNTKRTIYCANRNCCDGDQNWNHQ